jgi:hypothetical protein
VKRSSQRGAARGPKRLGKKPPRYSFFLNPYTDARFTHCPKCDRRTGQRKVPLVIHVDPLNPLALNYTCRYCAFCELLIVHQDKLESLMAAIFAERNPGIIGNDYLVLGTLDRPDWKRGLETPWSGGELLEHLHDFKRVLSFELIGGWMKAD